MTNDATTGFVLKNQDGEAIGATNATMPLNLPTLQQTENLISAAVAAVMAAIPQTTSDLPEGSRLYWTDGRFTAAFAAAMSASFSSFFNASLATKTTSDITEGSNLYWTNARFTSAFTAALASSFASLFSSSFSAKTTTDLAEGVNLYYTSGRFTTDFNAAFNTAFNTAFGGKTTSNLTEGTNLYYTAARFNTAFATKSTSDLTEGSNKYYTDARARAALSAGAGISYDSSTGVITSSISAPTFNNAVARTLSNAAGSTNRFTISATKNARVFYSLTVSWSITAILNSTATVYLEYSIDGGTNWLLVGQAVNNFNLGVILSGTNSMNLAGEVPLNALCRLRPSTSNATITYQTGQEILY